MTAGLDDGAGGCGSVGSDYSGSPESAGVGRIGGDLTRADMVRFRDSAGREWYWRQGWVMALPAGIQEWD